MNKIHLLDCTLRDGGYINDWEFGFENIKKIIFNLSKSNFDFVECGFLKSIIYNKNKTLFNNSQQLLNLLPDKKFKTNYCLMLNHGEISIKDIKENTSNIFLRIAFKKYQLKEALLFIEKLKEKNYKIFINPMHIDTYSEDEIIKLLKKVNKIEPYAFSIVDTIGVLDKYSLLDIFNIIDLNLFENCNICFHSHNNLKLSYSNALELIKHKSERNLILDCSLMGMGRCAGNLLSEDIAACFDSYNIELINKTIDEYIKPIYQKTPWGPSKAYLLSAIYKLHPNYAKYLSEKKFSSSEIKKVFNLIPRDKKDDFNSETIEKICSLLN